MIIVKFTPKELTLVWKTFEDLVNKCYENGNEKEAKKYEKITEKIEKIAGYK